jgi:amidohydrolase
MVTRFAEQARTLHPEMIARRRDLHRHPELAFDEVRTAGIVAQTLTDLGVEVRTGVGGTGVVGLLEGAGDGPTVLVRADMDALPIEEETGADYASTAPGVMHACGHDAHTSIGLAVARMLADRRDTLAGRVMFVFQPAEEIGKGAEAMVADGVLDDPRPDVSLGLHLWNTLPVGTVAVTPGPCMSAADDWACTVRGRGGHGASPHETRDPVVAAAQIITALQTVASRNVSPLDQAVVTVRGRGGHGASPHETRDPVVAAAQIITALQTVASRNVSPLDQAVVTVASLHAGDAFNIIPAAVRLKGTIRTYQEQTRELVHRRVHEICEGVAAAMGCEAEIAISTMTDPVANDPALCDRVAGIAARLVGADNVRHDIRTMGSEDMAFLMDGIPGCYFFIGSANAGRGLDAPHHSPHFDVDEDALRIGAALMASVVASFVLPEEG